MSCMSVKIHVPLLVSLSRVLLSEPIHLIVVMGWAGNVGGTLFRELSTLTLLEVEPPACPNTQPCGLCD